MRTRFTRWAIVAVALTLVASPATAAKKTTKKKKRKLSPVATAAPANTVGAQRNFTCVGRPNIQLTWRNVSGTIDGKSAVANVSVTQIYQKVGDALVEQPTVVLTSPNPPGREDPLQPLIIYRLNERPVASAADVDRLLTLYQFNVPTVLPPGPTFKGGLYFDTVVGAAGPLANEYRWSTVSSLAYSGLYEMDCTYT